MSFENIDRHIIIDRDHYTVNREMAGTTSWNETINISFIPDEIIIKSSSYFSGAFEQGTFFVSSNLFSPNFILPFQDNLSSLGDAINFLNKKPINGQFTFYTVEQSNSPPVQANIGYLFIILEFVRYGRK